MAESITAVPQLNNTMGQTKGKALEDGELPMEKTPEKHGDANGTSVSLVSPILPSGQGDLSNLMAMADKAGYKSGVPRGARGEGPPFAPTGWTWRVPTRARINKHGWYSDSFRKHPQASELGSRKAVGVFLQEKLKVPPEQAEEIQKSYEWHIPADPEEQSKDMEDVRAASGGNRGKQTSGTPVASSPRKRTTPPLLDDYEVRIVESGPAAAEEPAEDLPTLDEFLATPLNWPVLAARFRRLHKPHHINVLEEDAKKRGLSELKTQLLTFQDALVSNQMIELPHSVLSLIALIMTEGRTDDVRKKRIKISDLVNIVKGEVQGEAGGNEIQLSPAPAGERQSKRKRKSAPSSVDGLAKASKVDASKRKSTPLEDGGSDGTTKRTRKSVEQVASKTQDEASAMKSLLSTKPTASALSVSVDDDDPTEEEVEQAWATAGMVIAPAETGGLKEAPVPAPGTPAGIGQAADGSLASAIAAPTAAGPSTSMAAAAAPPAGPVTQQDLEILEYKRKLCKLEKIKREWNEAFDEKLNKYRAHKEALEQLVAKRKEDQEAQRKKIEEEKRKLKEAFDTAVKIIQMLEAAIGVPDTAAAELSKPKMPWESSFGAKVQTAREEKKRAWQDSMRQLNEARKMNVEQLKKKVEVYVKLGRTIPEEQIKAEKERSDAEWATLNKCLEEQKEEMDKQLESLNQMEAEARKAFVNYKSQQNRVEKELHKLDHMLKQGVV